MNEETLKLLLALEVQTSGAQLVTQLDAGVKQLVTSSEALSGASAHLTHTSTALEGAGREVEAAAGHAVRAHESFGKLGETFREVGKLAAGFVIGGAINELGAGLSERFKLAVTSATELGKATLELQRQIGGTTQSASQLLAVFERYGVGVDEASRALGIFSKHLAGIEDVTDGLVFGGKRFDQAMQDLGVTFLDAGARALPMDQVLLSLADKFHALPDGVDKSALSMSLFGRQGKDLIPILNLGAMGMQEAEDAARRYGLALSGANVEAVRQFGLAHKDLDEAVQGASVQIGMTLMPALTGLAREAASVAQEMNQGILPAIKQVNPAALGAAVGLVGLVAGAEALTPVLRALAASEVVVALENLSLAESVGVVGTAISASLGPVGLAIAAAGAFALAYQTNFLGTRTIVDQTTGQMSDDLTALARDATIAGDAIAKFANIQPGSKASILGAGATADAQQQSAVMTFLTHNWEAYKNELDLTLNPLRQIHEAQLLVTRAIDDGRPVIAGFTDGLGHAATYTDGFDMALLRLNPTILGFTSGLGGAEARMDAFGQKLQDQTAMVAAAYAKQQAAAYAAQVAAGPGLGHAADQIVAASDAMGGTMNSWDQVNTAMAAAEKRADAAAKALARIGVSAQASIPGLRALDDVMFGTSQKLAGVQLAIEQKKLTRMALHPAHTLGQQAALLQEQLRVEELQRQVTFGGAIRASEGSVSAGGGLSGADTALHRAPALVKAGSVGVLSSRAVASGFGASASSSQANGGGVAVTFNFTGLTVNDAEEIGRVVTAKLKALIAAGGNAPGTANKQLAGATAPRGS